MDPGSPLSLQYKNNNSIKCVYLIIRDEWIRCFVKYFVDVRQLFVLFIYCKKYNIARNKCKEGRKSVLFC